MTIKAPWEVVGGTRSSPRDRRRLRQMLVVRAVFDRGGTREQRVHGGLLESNVERRVESDNRHSLPGFRRAFRPRTELSASTK